MILYALELCFDIHLFTFFRVLQYAVELNTGLPGELCGFDGNLYAARMGSLAIDHIESYALVIFLCNICDQSYELIFILL